jgi:adenylate cyclase class IV
MSYRNREIESKLIVSGMTLNEVNEVLGSLFANSKSKMLFGSSVDTYWRIDNPDVDADFIRMRERDGIRQITVKGKDKGTNLDRLEVDVDSTSDVSKIVKLLTSAHGKPAGRIGKTYYVYWLGNSEHTTVCCYSLNFPDRTHLHIDGNTQERSNIAEEYHSIIVEVETTSMEKMLGLESQVMEAFRARSKKCERAPGSLFDMFIPFSGGKK